MSVLSVASLCAGLGGAANTLHSTKSESHRCRTAAVLHLALRSVLWNERFSLSTPQAEDEDARGSPLHGDSIQRLEKCRKRIHVARIEHTADRESAQHWVVDLQRDPGITVELVRHFAQGSLLERDLALQPGHRLRRIDRQRVRSLRRR